MLVSFGSTKWVETAYDSFAVLDFLGIGCGFGRFTGGPEICCKGKDCNPIRQPKVGICCTFALMDPTLVRSLHIIFVITWFAGLFYIVRLFIYHVEAQSRETPAREILQAQYQIMEKRLWYFITWPSAVLAIGFGFWLVSLLNYWLHPWMLLKFGLVAGLLFYHLLCGRIYRQLKQGKMTHSSIRLRLWNEVATLFLVAIVFVVEYKNLNSWLWGLLGLVLLAGVFFIAVRFYKKVREKSEA